MSLACKIIAIGMISWLHAIVIPKLRDPFSLCPLAQSHNTGSRDLAWSPIFILIRKQNAKISKKLFLIKSEIDVLCDSKINCLKRRQNMSGLFLYFLQLLDIALTL